MCDNLLCKLIWIIFIFVFYWFFCLLWFVGIGVDWLFESVVRGLEDVV